MIGCNHGCTRLPPSQGIHSTTRKPPQLPSPGCPVGCARCPKGRLRPFFLPFCARFSRGTQGRVVPRLRDREAKGCLFAPRRSILSAFYSSLATALQPPVPCNLSPMPCPSTRHQSLVTALLFLGGTANPEDVRQLTDKAEARRAASAQTSFPSRPACEKAAPEKVWILTTDVRSCTRPRGNVNSCLVAGDTDRSAI